MFKLFILITIITLSTAPYCNCDSYSADECESFYDAGCPKSTCANYGKQTKTNCKNTCTISGFKCSGKNNNGRCRCYGHVIADLLESMCDHLEGAKAVGGLHDDGFDEYEVPDDDGLRTPSDSSYLIAINALSLIFVLFCCTFGSFMWYKNYGRKAVSQFNSVGSRDTNTDNDLEETQILPQTNIRSRYKYAFKIGLFLQCILMVFLGGYVLGVHRYLIGLNQVSNINEDNSNVVHAPHVQARSLAGLGVSEDDVIRFAPKWEFVATQNAGYPINPQLFYQYVTDDVETSQCVQDRNDGHSFCDNKDFSFIDSGNVPTLYYIEEDCGRPRITYFIAFGFQHSCNTCFGQGDHQGGFELVTVVLNYDYSIYGVYFKQHSGWYFRLKSKLDFDGDHVKVYVGEYAHGTYYDKSDFYYDDIGFDAVYYGDRRSNDKNWIPTQIQLVDVTDLTIYSFVSGGQEPPTWNGLPQTWMKVNDSSDYDLYGSSDSEKEKYGREFFGKITKLRWKHTMCNKAECEGQDWTSTGNGQQGCYAASCITGNTFTDYTKDHVWRCKEGCGDGWQAYGDYLCKEDKCYSPKFKDRTTYGRDNQPGQI